MTRYCLICEKEWGPGVSACCAEGSLVATKVEGVFKKKRSYFTLDGAPLAPEQLDEIKRIARAKLKARTPAIGGARAAVAPATRGQQARTLNSKEYSPILRGTCDCLGQVLMLR